MGDLYDKIRTTEELLMYHLYKKGWQFINRVNSGFMTKGNVTIVIKKYKEFYKEMNEDIDDNSFTFSKDDINLQEINSIDDLQINKMPCYRDIIDIETDRCSWYVSYMDKLIDKGILTKAQISLKPVLNKNVNFLSKADQKKIEKFNAIINTIDMYGEMADYELLLCEMKPVMLKNRVMTRKIFSEMNIDIKEAGKSSNLETTVFKCVSNECISVSKDYYASISPILNALNLNFVSEDDLSVKLKYNLKMNHFYKIKSLVALTNVKNNMSVKAFQLNEYLDDLSDYEKSNNLIVFLPKILLHLVESGILVTGLVLDDKYLIDAKNYVRDFDIRMIQKLPPELEILDLGVFQKSILLKAYINNINYTLLLNNQLDMETYEALYDLLCLGVDPLLLLNPEIKYDAKIICSYKYVLSLGLDLNFFIDNNIPSNQIEYFADNMNSSIEESCQEYVESGYSTEHLKYIKRCLSRRESPDYIKPEDSLINLSIKDYMKLHDNTSVLYNELLNDEYNKGEVKLIRFQELSIECKRDLASHLFCDIDFYFNGVLWKDIVSDYILGNAEAVMYRMEFGLNICIHGNLYLQYDENSITFNQIDKPLCKILFVDNKVLYNDSFNLLKYLSV